MIPRILTFAALSAAVALGQLEPNTVTVTASRTMTVQPDQILFSVSVNSGISTTLADVLTALQPAGITAANFVSVNSQLNFVAPPPASPTVQWYFTLPVPFAGMKASVTSLAALQQSINQNNSGLTLSFSVQGTQVSQQLQQMQVCPLSDLFSDALAQAQKLANAAGLSAGNVLALSNVLGSGAIGSTYAVLGASFVSSMVPSVCSMTVKFALTR